MGAAAVLGPDVVGSGQNWAARGRARLGLMGPGRKRFQKSKRETAGAYIVNHDCAERT